jgi:hypothetical protein
VRPNRRSLARPSLHNCSLRLYRWIAPPNVWIPGLLVKNERLMNCGKSRARKWRLRARTRDTGRVAITPASAANFIRSVIAWLQVGYPEGVPGPDRIPLLALLRSTPLSEEEITEVVDSIDEDELSDGAVDRDVIADFISDMTHYDASPENIARVAARLAAAGWPLSGINDQAGTTAAPASSQG